MSTLHNIKAMQQFLGIWDSFKRRELDRDFIARQRQFLELHLGIATNSGAADDEDRALNVSMASKLEQCILRAQMGLDVDERLRASLNQNETEAERRIDAFYMVNAGRRR